MKRLQVVELTLLRHPPFTKNRRGLQSGPGFHGGKWRRLITRTRYITLTITPKETTTP